MDLNWHLFTNCTSQEAALKVAARLFEQIGLGVSSLRAESYHKGGFTVRTTSSHVAQTWAEFVVLALALAQSAGRAWILNGSIADELDAWSNDSTVSGVSSIHVQATRQQRPISGTLQS